MGNRSLPAAALTLAGILVVCGATAMGNGTREAYSADATPPGIVRSADLDLTQRAGMTALMGRLDYAATQVCGVEPTRQYRQDLHAFAVARAVHLTCATGVKQRAIASLDMPVIASLSSDYPSGIATPEGVTAALREAIVPHHNTSSGFRK